MHPCALYVGLGVLQGRKRSVLCVCCCDCDRGAVLVVCVVVVVLWCARWSSLALIGVQKHRGVLVCRRGHRKHDNDPQSGGTGEGKYRQNKRQRKFLTSAGFPSVWCLSGVPEGLLIAGDHQTSIQTRGKSNSPPSRSRPRQRGRRCPLLHPHARERTPCTAVDVATFPETYLRRSCPQNLQLARFRATSPSSCPHQRKSKLLSCRHEHEDERER